MIKTTFFVLIGITSSSLLTQPASASPLEKTCRFLITSHYTDQAGTIHNIDQYLKMVESIQNRINVTAPDRKTYAKKVIQKLNTTLEQELGPLSYFPRVANVLVPQVTNTLQLASTYLKNEDYPNLMLVLDLAKKELEKTRFEILN